MNRGTASGGPLRRALRAPAFAVTTIVASVVFATGCGGGENVAPAFQRGDLQALTLPVSQAPTDVRYAPSQSGAGTLERQGLSRTSLETLRDYGFETDFGRQFYGRSARKGVTYTGSVAALFQDAKGADRALEFLEQRLKEEHPQAAEVGSFNIGDESWGLSGPLFTGARPGFTAVYYAWRIGNLVQTFSLTGYRAAVRAAAPTATAKRLARRAVEEVRGGKTS
jgi:hypothetical protein